MRQWYPSRWHLALLLFLASGLLLFPWWLVVVELVLGVALWGLMAEGRSSSVRGQGDWSCWLMLLLMAVLRALIFFWGAVPFGYDTGIYRYEFWQSFSALPSYESGVFLGLPLLSDVMQLFGLSLDGTLLGSAWLFAVLAAAALMLVVRERWGTTEALVAGGLYAISVVQWQAYEMILLKQLLALALVFACFFLMMRRSYWLMIPLVFLALLQPLDAFFLGLVILVTAFFEGIRGRWKGYWSGMTILGVGALGLLLVLAPQFWQEAWQVFWTGLFAVGDLEMSLRQGVFLDLESYGYQASFFFVLGGLGAVWSWKKEGWGILQTYGVLVLLWVILELFFYQRLLIQLDAVLICFAALPLVWLLRHGRERLIATVLLIGCALPFGMLLMDFDPLLPDEERLTLAKYCDALPEGDYVMATDSFYAPWLRGYCLNQRVIAPGMFEWGAWTEQQWRSFWRGTGALDELFAVYDDAPVWLYVGSKQPELTLPEALFEPIDEHWWRFRGLEDPSQPAPASDRS